MITWWPIVLHSLGGYPLIVAWLVLGIVSVCLHELAHGYAAIRVGDRTPIYSGHMTWDPSVHMGFNGIVMLIFLGLPTGFMPINPSAMRGRSAPAFVAAAGPVMNLAIAVVCIIVAAMINRIAVSPATSSGALSFLKITDPSATPADRAALFFMIGAWLNIALAAFNLLPIPPLDGSRIVGTYSRKYEEFFESEFGRLMALGAFIIAWVFLSQFVWDYAIQITVWLHDHALTVLRLI
ncbi:MAG: site-2 protease family protein [Phycisphaerales bacterium]|nr:site-2 protease family protein [Phycisphaerales bacterium]